MLVDTHTHLYLPEFETENGTPAAAVERAIDAGVGMMVFPNIDLASIEPMKRLHAMFPSNTAMAMGLHPTEVGDDADEVLAAVTAELDGPTRYVAIGEVGVDLYWDKSRREQQMQAFDTQCRMAVERNLPVIVHCREALDEVLEVISGLDRKPRLVMHSFGGTSADVERIRTLLPEAMFGINGIVTFKNSRLRYVLPAIGLDYLLLETDSPYLAPVPMRGRRNESAYITHTAAHIAASLNLPLPEVAEATTASALRFFSLP